MVAVRSELVRRHASLVTDTLIEQLRLLSHKGWKPPDEEIMHMEFHGRRDEWTVTHN